MIKSRRVNVTMPSDLYEMVEKYAKTKGVSLSNYVLNATKGQIAADEMLDVSPEIKMQLDVLQKSLETLKSKIEILE